MTCGFANRLGTGATGLVLQTQIPHPDRKPGTAAGGRLPVRCRRQTRPAAGAGDGEMHERDERSARLAVLQELTHRLMATGDEAFVAVPKTAPMTPAMAARIRTRVCLLGGDDATGLSAEDDGRHGSRRALLGRGGGLSCSRPGWRGVGPPGRSAAAHRHAALGRADAGIAISRLLKDCCTCATYLAPGGARGRAGALGGAWCRTRPRAAPDRRAGGREGQDALGRRQRDRGQADRRAGQSAATACGRGRDRPVPRLVWPKSGRTARCPCGPLPPRQAHGFRPMQRFLGQGRFPAVPRRGMGWQGRRDRPISVWELATGTGG